MTGIAEDEAKRIATATTVGRPPAAAAKIGHRPGLSAGVIAGH